jgi:MoxR-like ATPase
VREPTDHPQPPDAVRAVASGASALGANLERVVVGKRAAVDLVVTALLAGGHVLLQDVPGVGKTVLAKALAVSIGGSFRRIQGTPDLLPSDITGGMVYDAGRGALRFVPGPLFANVVLADELNRATPRAQAAFLEALDEGRVSVEGSAHPLPQPFFLIATLNPLEHHGTYPLPEGELDRFLVSTSLGYPDLDDEVEVIARQRRAHPLVDLQPVVSPAEVLAWQQAVREVYVDRSVMAYAAQVAAATRSHPEVSLGASPRASVGLVRLAQARAACQGRAFVLPDDVKDLALPVLAHRLVLRSRAITAEDVVQDILETVVVPVFAGR